MSLKPPQSPTSTLQSSGLLVPTSWVDVTASPYNADPTGVSDSTSAIQAAINALPNTAASPRGGTVYFPKGVYKTTSALDVKDTENITFRGATDNCANDPSVTQTSGTSRIKYTPTGTGTIIDARSTQAFTMVGIAVSYDSATYTGKVVDLSHSLAGDSQHTHFSGCAFGGTSASATNAAALISLKHAIFARIHNCYFGRAVDAIRGCEDTGGSTNYSNSHTIRDCQFARHQNSIVNAGECWVVDGCGFEGTGGTLQHAYKDDIPDANNSIVTALRWTGNWMGDAFSAVPDYWMDFGFNEVRGLYFAGNSVSQKKLMIFRNGGRSNVIIGAGGADTDHIIDLGVEGHLGIVILASEFNGGSATVDPLKNRTSPHTGKVILGNNWPTGAASLGFDEIQLKGGHIGSPQTSTTPTVFSIHANAGSGATCTLGTGSSDLGGFFTLTTGTGPGAGVFNLVSFTHGRPYSNAFSPIPTVVISAGNTAAATAIGSGQVYTNDESVSGWSLGSTGALAASTAHIFKYHILQ